MKNQIDPAPSSGNPIGAYYYRRPLSASELLPAVSVGLGAALLAGLATFYLTRVTSESIRGRALSAAIETST